MSSLWSEFLRHEWRRLTGRILAKGRLHRIQNVAAEGIAVMLKSRRLGSRFLTTVGNGYLQLQRSGVEVLSNGTWLRWEAAVESVTNQGVVYLTRPKELEKFHGLVSRVCPGMPLRDILRADAYSIDQKFDAIGWAFESLFQLHRNHADWGNNVHQPISHGDATVCNVMIHLDTRSAKWIDFDTRHLPYLCERDRHADDVRALAFSAAAHLPRSRQGHLVTELLGRKPQEPMMERLCQRLRTDWSRPNVFHLAQAPLSHADYEALLREILGRAPEID